MDKKPQVIVVGGGAAGLTAGIMAARNGAAVTILEQNENCLLYTSPSPRD